MVENQTKNGKERTVWSGSRYRLALASASPRRQAFLTDLGFEFSAAATDADESPLPGEKPILPARRLAESKAQAAAQQLGADSRLLLIVAADTVALGDELFGKPGRCGGCVGDAGAAAQPRAPGAQRGVRDGVAGGKDVDAG